MDGVHGIIGIGGIGPEFRLTPAPTAAPGDTGRGAEAAADGTRSLVIRPARHPCTASSRQAGAKSPLSPGQVGWQMLGFAERGIAVFRALHK